LLLARNWTWFFFLSFVGVLLVAKDVWTTLYSYTLEHCSKSERVSSEVLYSMCNNTRERRRRRKKKESENGIELTTWCPLSHALLVISQIETKRFLSRSSNWFIYLNIIDSQSKKKEKRKISSIFTYIIFECIETSFSSSL
jgi:hypothetical protein